MTTPRRSLADRLAAGPIVLDGGLATELERRGHELADALWSARLLRDSPDTVEAVHRAYFEAGADVAITASYQASFEGFAAAGAGREEAAALLRTSVELARRARDAVRPDGLVAASVGPYAVVLADGSEYRGYDADVTEARIAEVHRPRIDALLAAEPDVLAFETIPALIEVAALIDQLDGSVESWISFSCRDGGHLNDGTPVEEAARLVGESGRVTAVGVNCTPPEHIGELVERIRAVTRLPILVYPNSGRLWDGTRRDWHGVGVEGLPASLVAAWTARGARGVGGCCGIGPAAIAGVARALHGDGPPAVAA